MTIRSVLLGFIALCSLASVGMAAAKPGVEIAITPFLPVRTMVQNYETMRLHLEKQLKQPVLFITAPDYRTFHERTRKQEYDYLITVANAAYLAQAESSYVPLFRPAVYTRPTLVVAKGAPLEQVTELRGKTVAMPDSLAIISMQGQAMLREAGLEPERDVTLKHMRNHGAAVNLVLAGDAMAAIVSDRALAQMPAATRDGVRVLQTWEKGAAPGVVYLVSPKLSKATREKFSRAVRSFVESPDGMALMQQLGYGTLLSATAADLQFLAPYGAALKEGLARPE